MGPDCFLLLMVPVPLCQDLALLAVNGFSFYVASRVSSVRKNMITSEADLHRQKTIG